MNELVLTFDMDWVTDSALIYTEALLSKSGVRSTWFVTHETPMIKKLAQNPDIELGLHPNFLQGSTQGKDPYAIMRNLKTIVPAARAVRSHAMCYSACIAKMYAEEGMVIDSSVYLGGMANVEPFMTEYAEGLKILRMPYIWSDDGELIKKTPEWALPVFDGLKILCFHPVHVLLNTTSWEMYLRYKQRGGRLSKSGRQVGVRDYLENIIWKGDSFKTLSDIAREYYDI